MPQRRRILPTLAVAVIFIVLEVAALRFMRSDGIMQDFFLARISHVFKAKVWGGTQRIGDYFALRGANDRLAEENFRLAQQVRSLEADRERRHLDSLAGTFGRIGDFRFQRGNIVKNSRGRQHNYLILGQGSEDGVTVHTGVITSRGVVGIVDAVGRHYSYALSFLNPEVSISARLGRDGAVGPLVWDGVRTDGAILREIPLQHKFNPGDTVRTSGYSSIFPPDIPLGTVEDSKIVNGATYDIRVRLFEDISAVRYVTLVSNDGRAEIQDLEKEETP